MNELRDKITEIVREEIGWWLSPLVKEEADRPFIANQILALVKEAGYVKLADDWGLPDGFVYKGCGDREYTQYCAGQTDMLKAGWRRVEIWKSP